jgi:hypothetical protein
MIQHLQAAALLGANSSRPTGSFRQRPKAQKVYTMCSAQSVYDVPVLTETHLGAGPELSKRHASPCTTARNT